MYVDISKSGRYRRVLLRESYREAGKVKKRTVANISNCSDESVALLQLALRHADQLPELLSGPTEIERSHGKSVGAVFVAAELARRSGITPSLGSGREADLALWQIIARLIDQAEIEDRLFQARHTDEKVDLFLYDVTSSYLEGTHNELGTYGYNRDGKKGKMQIVIGLLCDQKGDPVSVQVFSGNTSDVTTFSDQVKKVADRFGCRRITFVGDRGMIKSGQKKELSDSGFSYITALTRKQIETLENKGVIQLGLFDETLCEVEKDNLRYILRRNPCRAEDIAATRLSKETPIKKLILKKNKYLAEHPQAKVETALREIKGKIKKLNCKWLTIEAQVREMTLLIDSDILTELSRLDGCYVITTDLPADAVTATQAHAYYKDLSKVERAFRESKTGHLELRPIHVRKEKSTRGHVLVVMLAYLLRRELERAWEKVDVTMEEGLDCLATLSSIDMGLAGEIKIERVPKPKGLCGKLLDALNFTLPTKIIRSKLNVSTKVKTRKQR